MSSLRNAVQRRPHRERAQPASRARLGILEKHRDYALRAKDYSSKKRHLRALRSKASARNPDEFYFAMTNARTTRGGALVADRPGNSPMSMTAVRGLKMQDKAYLKVMADMERRKRERLESELTFVDVDGTIAGASGVGIGKKKVFTEDGHAVAVKANTASASTATKGVVSKKSGGVWDDDDDEMDWEDDNGEGEAVEEKPSRQELKAAKARTAKYRELEARMKREAELLALERDLDAQREFMGKSGPRTGKTRDGKRWFNNARKK
ncbi:hypothetical protein DRE_07236 [Drechslerella stenobrocha 248]|uniref:U3 small nucleolar RNA-associated protein 11 n=1 Tax=Drechslerella stenobrocha 248 TaxID=1043628 RepID=W7HLC2_9PEZI|nr:hypothetical protein DRE_07236 [Drechslerella stenobrocha 248]